MRVDYTRKFRKRYKKMPAKLQQQFKRRVALYLEHSRHALLRVHQLTGVYVGCSSMNIIGDIRAIFTLQEDGVVLFIAIGSHSEL